MKVVIVVRKDLNMRKGKMCAQVGHAVHKMAHRRRWSRRYRKYMRQPITKIVVGIDKVKDLEAICDAAESSGVFVERIVDSGKTAFGGVPTFTCAALGPDEDEVIDIFTRMLPLL